MPCVLKRWKAEARVNSKECPKCKDCSPDDAASCRTCGAEFPSNLRPITPEDVTREGDRNYDLGRKHTKGEVSELTIEPMKAALEGLLLAASKLRIRVNHNAPNLVKFSEWDELTEAMRTAEHMLGKLRRMPSLCKKCGGRMATRSAEGFNRHGVTIEADWDECEKCGNTET